MRYFLSAFLLFITSLYVNGQNNLPEEAGSVSYITPQNIYVKFQSTGNIRKGDTIFVRQNDKEIPALVVKYLSSTSCYGVPVSEIKLNVGDKVYLRQSTMAASEKTGIAGQQPFPSPVQKTDSLPVSQTVQKKRIQQVRGYFSIASYTNLSNSSAANSQRMKYTFSMTAKNIGDSKLSADIYISFIHSNKTWGEIQKNG